MATPDGDFVRGREAIRQQWEGFVALGGTITVVTRHAVEVGDLALLSNDWHFTGAGMELSSRTSGSGSSSKMALGNTSSTILTPELTPNLNRFRRLCGPA